MDGRARRWAADAVTVSRVPIGLAMVLVRRRRTAVSALFVLGVTTDVIDGRLARRFGTSSSRGARLDSAADAAFAATSIAAVVATVDHATRRPVSCAAGIVAATRLATLLATRRRFRCWSVMHTRLNKATGLALGGVTATALLRGRMPVVASGAVAVLAEVAAIEELAIVLSSPDYDADRASLLERPGGGGGEPLRDDPSPRDDLPGPDSQPEHYLAQARRLDPAGREPTGRRRGGGRRAWCR